MNFSVIASLLLILNTLYLAAEPVSRGVPTPEQIEWHKLEVTMFIHFSPATWQNRELDDHSTPLADINPSKLNTDQWCEVAKSFGARQIVFVAKHVGDFCWWQTDTTNYGIKETPYQNGKGDVLKDLSQSCKKHGLKLGIYVYPGNHELGAGVGSGGITKDPANQELANQIYRTQMTEVLSRYGTISEMWFDGSCLTPVKDILDRYAPHAMIFQGAHATLRWPGNEHGHSPYPAWQSVKKADAASGVSTGQHGDPDGDCWLPMEMDTTLLDKAWFWKPGWENRIKTVEQLLDIYMKSVGRGGVLLLNASPDTTGLIPQSHVNRYQEFGKAIQRIYKNKKGETSGKGKTFEIMFTAPTAISHFVTMEEIQYGHIIRGYEVDGLVNDAWQSLHKGISVGYKQIDSIKPIEVRGVRLRITESADLPQLKSFAVYEMQDAKIVQQNPLQAEWQRVGELPLTDAWKTIDIDLTQQISDVGQYEIEIRPNAGLEIKSIVAVMAGTEAQRLITKQDRPFAWNINRTDVVVEGPQGRTALRVTAKSNIGDSPASWIYIRKAE